MTNRLRGVLLAIAVLGAGCGPDATTGDGDEPHGTVLVFAAASLTDAFVDIESAFEAANPEVDIALNLAGSSALREQILDGAPADVFASANQSNMDDVVEAGDTAGRPTVFARNRLEIAVPAGNPGGVAGLDAFADENLLIGLCARGVPCGDLGRAVLARAGVDASVDTDEPDVRALLTKIGADELDAGMVYATDVIAAGDDVEGIDIPPALNAEATYPIVTLAGATNPVAAAAFVAFVLSADGQALLAGHGFAPA